jgi:hypothetical protein
MTWQVRVVDVNWRPVFWQGTPVDKARAVILEYLQVHERASEREGGREEASERE